jgi:hypothetical protein
MSKVRFSRVEYVNPNRRNKRLSDQLNYQIRELRSKYYEIVDDTGNFVREDADKLRFVTLQLEDGTEINMYDSVMLNDGRIGTLIEMLSASDGSIGVMIEDNFWDYIRCQEEELQVKYEVLDEDYITDYDVPATSIQRLASTDEVHWSYVSRENGLVEIPRTSDT